MLVTQAEFANMKSVTPAAVSQWKSEDRLVVVGKKIDVEASEKRLLRESRFHSKRVKPATVADVKLSLPPTELVKRSSVRLHNDDHYSAGTCSGINGMACSVPALVAEAAIDAGIPAELAQALNAALRPALLRRMELLMDLWGIHPFITADDDETNTILGRDTWVGRQWPEDALDDGYLMQDLAEAHLL